MLYIICVAIAVIALARWITGGHALPGAPLHPLRFRFAFTWGLVRVDVHAFGAVSAGQWLVLWCLVGVHALLYVDFARSALRCWALSPHVVALENALLSFVSNARAPVSLPPLGLTVLPTP